MGGRRNRIHGKRAEERTKRYYENLGWMAVLTAAKEPCDLIIWNDFKVLAVEVKATAKHPTPSMFKPLTEMWKGKLDGKIVCWWPLHARKPEIWALDEPEGEREQCSRCTYLESLAYISTSGNTCGHSMSPRYNTNFSDAPACELWEPKWEVK